PFMSSIELHCRTAGRLRNVVRSRFLLAGWQAHDLPAAPSQDGSQALLGRLIGPALLQRVTSALNESDTLAQRTAGCARDAYTVLYGCSALAVLLAAWGAAIESHTLRFGLAMAELGTLVVLFLTFRNAHKANW